jgi:hypothetical protein
MTKKAMLLVPLLLLVWATACAGRDMDKVCPIAEEVYRDASIPAEEKVLTFARRVDDAVWSSGAKNVFRALEMVSHADKYEVLKAGAAELGRPDWECPALRDAFAAAR